MRHRPCKFRAAKPGSEAGEAEIDEDRNRGEMRLSNKTHDDWERNETSKTMC